MILSIQYDIIVVKYGTAARSHHMVGTTAPLCLRRHNPGVECDLNIERGLDCIVGQSSTWAPKGAIFNRCKVSALSFSRKIGFKKSSLESKTKIKKVCSLGARRP